MGTVKTPFWIPATGKQGIAQLDGIRPVTSGHDRLDAAHHHRIDVVQDRAAIFAEEMFVTHAGTFGKVEMRPLRVRVKSCLNSPRLILLVTLLT